MAYFQDGRTIQALRNIARFYFDDHCVRAIQQLVVLSRYCENELELGPRYNLGNEFFFAVEGGFYDYYICMYVP